MVLRLFSSPSSSSSSFSPTTKGAISSASRRVASASEAKTACSRRASCCSSCWDCLLLREDEEAGWKKLVSWEAAMKSVMESLRARIRNWKGRRGGWAVKIRRRGLMILVRRGGK